MENFGQNQPKILRAPSLKRGKPDERITDRIKLEKVLGVTVSTNAALDCDPHTETVAYPAGCTVVLFNTQTGQQSHIVNTSRRSISSLAFSSCGRYLVTGECGHQPAVRVWDLQSDPQVHHPGLYPQFQQVAEFQSHKYGICCVAFSPTNKYVVSIGTQHDMIVNVWDWRNNIKVASNKVSTKVKSLAFSENGSYFVTVGNRHVKFWFLEYGKTKYKEAVPLMGRSAILGEQRNNYFCDVACGKVQCGDSTYAITRSGLLCEFNNRRLLDKWVELRTTSANCIVVGEQYIFVGCAEGIVRCFDPSTLRFITTLPRTHYLGVDVCLGLTIQHMSSPPPDSKYPDAVAITYDETSNKLTVIYNDHSIYVWDVHNIKRVGKSHSFLFHSACIWGVEMPPPNSIFPPGSFLSCSSDDTIRVWTLDQNQKPTKNMYNKNIYSNELLKIVYVDDDLTYLKDVDASANNVEKPESSYDGRNGVRCIKLSPDGKHLASGDRAGNIRIHDTTSMKERLKIEAHDAEVLCLEYTSIDTDHKLMASASRDRLIHVFDVNGNYNFLQTLDDHSSSITAVRLLTSAHGNLQMVSCGADKSLIFRSLGGTPNGTPQFTRGHNATGKTTLYDMEVDSGQKHVLTACQDRNVRIYSVGTGKHTKSFKGSTGDDGTLIKVVLDRSGIYLATSCTDKSLSVYDYYTGECMATMCGHSELATGLRFTNDCKRLISASGDGCIFVWKVPHDMVVTMHARLSQQAMRQGKTLDSEIFSDSNSHDFYDATADSDYRFSIGQLPQWAKKHISDDTSPPVSLTKGVAAPKGRWAQRAERNVSVKSFYSADSTVIPFPSNSDRRLDSDGSKDSSLDSGMEVRQYSDVRKDSASFKQVDFTDDTYETKQEISTSNVTLTRGEFRRTHLTDDSALGSLRDPDESTAHDGDIDSDQEYRHQPLYYPSQVDSASGSEFTVTNIDADELRKSMRKAKRGNLPTISIQPTSISGSQESDDDDDDASTPSGENTDRNPLSILSVSSESLDQIATREKYLQSTFESLSGAEMESPAVNKSSISAQYHTRTNGTPKLRNMAVINATKQAKNDPDTITKREELLKMIADTKKKLANVGHNSPLKYSKSIHDLSHIPEKEKWGSPGRKQGTTTQVNVTDFPYQINNDDPPHNCVAIPNSHSVPVDLQLCDCHYTNVNNTHRLNVNETLKLSDVLNKSPEKHAKNLAAMIKPRKLQLDKTLNKFKMHKSLPVSPVNEEVSFRDFVDNKREVSARRSFSYFVDFKDETDRGFKEICADIEKFSEDFNRNYEELGGILHEEDDGNFSSDSLEESCTNSVKNKKKSKELAPPRRCVSNNEIYKYQEESTTYSEFYHAYDCRIPKSESFYLNPSNKNSQDSILSEDTDYDYQKSKSFCNSLESVLSNESECRSAPLEVLFTSQRNFRQSETGEFSKSLPKNHDFFTKPNDLKRSHTFTAEKCLRTSETQTEDFEVRSTRKVSTDFQKKLLKFETCIAANDKNSNSKKGVAFFVDTKENIVKKEIAMNMNIPSLESKNKQYKSKFCNVLNNKPEINIEIFETGHKNKSFTLTNLNFGRNKNQIQETSSLDRHLLSKGLLDTEKITHKPPKAVRRHSSKTRKKTYEYIKKDDFFKKHNNHKRNNNCSNENLAPSVEKTIEVCYKEKNFEKECENGNNFLNELYDSLDKPSSATKFELDSLEVNVNHIERDTTLFDSLEIEKSVYSNDFNLWKNSEIDKLKTESPKKIINLNQTSIDRIQTALENIKILNEIQKTVQKINNLVDVFKQNVSKGKVRALSKMYESYSVYNDLSKYQEQPKIKFRRRNLSLPNFVERRLNLEKTEKRSNTEQQRSRHPLREDRKIDRDKCNVEKSQIQEIPESKDSLQVTQGSKDSLQLSRESKDSLLETRESQDSLQVTRESKDSLQETRESKDSLQETRESKDSHQVKRESRDSLQEKVQIDADSNDSNLRRSCSLSDLSMPAAVVQPKRKIEQVSGKLQKSMSTARVPQRYSKSSSVMTRSSSTGVLNQSDSEPEIVAEKKSQSRLMRPTISSLNKLASVKSTTSVRKRHSHSVMNLSTIGNEDSSSEDNDTKVVQKPTVPPRTRNLSSESQLSRKTINSKEKPKAMSRSFDRKKSVDLPDLDSTLTAFNDSSENLDISTVQLSTQLCDEVALQLTKAANNVVEVYRRLADTDANTTEQISSVKKTDMAKNLEMSITRTQKLLQDITLDRLRRNNGIDVNQTDTVKKLNDLVAKGVGNDQNTMVTMMQQYSDIMLSLMQQKMQNT